MRPAAALARILDGLAAIADQCGEPDLRVERVSLWSVGQHIEHLLKVDDTIHLHLTSSTIGTPVPPLTWIGRVILIAGRIPRGRAKAPEWTKPTGDYVALRKAVERTSHRFRELEPIVDTLSRDTIRIAHPSLGGLTRRQWLRFTDIHQRHHHAIIRDIRAAAPVSEP